MKKRNLFISLLTLTLIVSSALMSPVAAQDANSPTIVCIPVQQFAKNKTQLECRLKTPETPYFLVAEVTFPFRISQLIKVSSSYSASLGSLYPSTLVENTILIGSVDWGSQASKAELQAIPFDSFSILLETEQSMAEVKQAFAAKQTSIALLSPNPSDPANPFFQTTTPAQTLLFDGSLLLESFTQYVSSGVLQFLRLGVACYEKTPRECLTNVIQNL